MTDSKQPGRGKPGPKPLGKYLLKRVVGRGGMGVVYEAEDTQIGRRVALKIMVPRPGVDPKEAEAERQRFVREAQLAAKLKHPNIVTVFEAGVIEGKRYLAMEFIEGRPFSDWWADKSVKLSQKIGALRDIALAVDHAHEKDILHRDLKPANILVGSDNVPYVMDFGLAKVMGSNVGLSLTGDGLTVGTPAYMSPEQARGLKTVDGRTDVYALGVMLYEILAGRKPFEGETAIEILMKATNDRVAPPSSSRVAVRDPAINQIIENICLKALAKDPKNRYATAKGLAQDMDRWLSGESVKINVNFSSTRRRIIAGRPQKKSTGWIWGLVAAGVLAVVVVPFLMSSSPPPLTRELLRARQLMSERKFTEARIEFEQILARDPNNPEARNGIRRARLEEERRKAKAERLAAATAQREKLKLEAQAAQAAQADSDRETKEAEEKIAAAAQASDEEKQKLMAELEAIRARARKAEEEAKKAREALEALDDEKPAPAPVPPPAPNPAPPAVAAKPAPPPIQKASPKPAPVAAPEPVRRKAAPAELNALREASLAHASALDLAAAFSLIDKAAEEAEIDSLEEKDRVLKAARKSVKSRKDAALLATWTLQLAEQALELDEFRDAGDAAKDAARIARQAGDAALAEDAALLSKKISGLKPVHDRYKKALGVLKSSPEDGKANLDAGRWLCLGKGRWAEGLPLLQKGSDRALRDVATGEAANPSSASDHASLGEGWFGVAQKERNRTLKNACLARAAEHYQAALPGLSGRDKVRVTARLDQCYALGDLAARYAFVADKSMDPYPAGYQTGSFPPQKGGDATSPFRGEGIYFNQRTGTDVVYEIRAGKRYRRLKWKGAAMSRMTIEVLDLAGNVLASGGPYGGGNTWGEFTLDFPPTARFILRLRNNVGTWYYVDRLTLE